MVGGVSVLLILSQSVSAEAQQVNAYPFDFTDVAVSLTESVSTNASNLSLLVDNDETTIYKVEGVKSAQITAELKFPIVLTGFAFATPKDKTMSTTGWRVDYSLDGKAWIKVSTTKSTQKDNLWVFVNGDNNPTKNNPISAKYYRLTATGSTDVEVGEWQLYGLPYMNKDQHFPDDITSEEGFVTGSSSGYERAHKNLAHEYAYMFNVEIDIPKNAKQVKLPNNTDVVIFSATLADDANNEIYPATELIDTSMKNRGEDTNKQ